MLIDKTEVEPPPKPKDYVNPGLDTKSLAVPRAEGSIIRFKGKSELDNKVLPINSTIKTFVRDKKMPYKHVKYKDDYTPPVFEKPTPTL